MKISRNTALNATAGALIPLAVGWSSKVGRAVRLQAREYLGLEGRRGAGWAWGTHFLDADNDGFLDLFTLAGFHTAPREVEKVGDT